jgi:proteasome accessory factor B
MPTPVGPPGAFAPPEGLDLAAAVAGSMTGGEERVAVVRARPGTAVGLRRHARPLGPAGDGDDRLEVRTPELGMLADQLAVLGDDVIVESPPELRDAVVQRLTRLATMGSPA